MATKKASGGSKARKTVRKATKKVTKAGKAAPRKLAKKAAAKKTTRKPAKKAAAKKIARKPAKKAASKKTARKSVRKVATNKATRRPAKKTAPAETARGKPVKKAVGKSAKRRAARGITPAQALANTRKLLREKQAHDRRSPPWQAIDAGPGQGGQPGYQSAEAAQRAEDLHAGESRMPAIQGSIDTRQRHNQGKRDSR